MLINSTRAILLLLGKELLEEDFIVANPAWHKELSLMVSTKVKAEIQVPN